MVEENHKRAVYQKAFIVNKHKLHDYLRSTVRYVGYGSSQVQPPNMPPPLSLTDSPPTTQPQTSIAKEIRAKGTRSQAWHFVKSLYHRHSAPGRCWFVSAAVSITSCKLALQCSPNRSGGNNGDNWAGVTPWLLYFCCRGNNLICFVCGGIFLNCVISVDSDLRSYLFY